MGPPRYAATFSRGSCRTHELKQKPEAQEEKGSDLHEIGYEENWNEGKDSGVRVKQKVRAHYTGNSSACPNSRKLGVPIYKQMGETRCEATQKVEKEISNRAQPVLHVVAKDVKDPHVTEEVPETPMKKHEGQE